MKLLGNLFIGTAGTTVAATAPHVWAATFAGVMTGLWMARQLWISFRK